MGSRELKNKPLVEAICEIRWKLQPKAPDMTSDPNYRLLLGRLYDRLNDQYPEHEQLDAANVPDEFVGHMVQHRFRSGRNDWPIVQLGPGVITVNDTYKYKWDDFCPRVVDVANKLYDAYPKRDELRVDNLLLRYIDAVDFDYQSSDVCEFLKEMLKVSISLPPSLFDGDAVEPFPHNLSFVQTFRCKKPAGIIELRIGTGKRADKPSIIWETRFRSVGPDVPKIPDSLQQWLEEAHYLMNDWFFKMIDGELLRKFSNA